MFARVFLVLTSDHFRNFGFYSLSNFDFKFIFDGVKVKTGNFLPLFYYHGI